METTAINLTRGQLLSQAVRNVVGERFIDIAGALATNQNDGNGNIIDFLFNSAKKLIGFAIGAITSIGGWLLSKVRDWFVNSLLTLYTFDWAQTDKALEEQMKQNNLAIVTSIGELAGTGAVYLGSIAIAGAATYKFPVIAGTVLLQLAEQGGDELRSKLTGLINIAVDKQAENFVISSFLTARKLRLFGQQPIDKQREPWIISDRIEKAIDGVKNDVLKAFLNGVKNSVEDAIFEMVYVVSFGIEEAYRSAKLAQTAARGKEKLIEIQPDETLEREKIVLRGGSEELKPAVTQVLGSAQLVRNRDMGQMVGIPLADYVKANPHVRKLSVQFRGLPEPPYRNLDGSQVQKVTYNIPDVKVGLTWQTIKTACQPFEWGKYRCTANLSNGRQMAVYGASPSEAEQTLRRLLTLSNADILTLSITEEKDRNAKLRKNPIRVYPAYATLLTRRTDLDDPQYVDLTGKGYAEFTTRMPLYPDTEPDDLPPLQ